MLACIACIEDRDLQTQRGERGKGSHIRCDLGSEASKGEIKNQLKEGKNAAIVRCIERRGSRMGRGLRACRPWSFPISGRTYVTVGCRVACSAPRRDERKEGNAIENFRSLIFL